MSEYRIPEEDTIGRHGEHGDDETGPEPEPGEKPPPGRRREVQATDADEAQSSP